ncbi:hypothetical protein SCHPADRAFT_952843 [Schizopora paradoxa]|uniref:DUF6534 domain-containing protein n=1 Tax=Schizopora paradoxa TaxID=27342 RepID=A0A0H2SBX7_9AGAM|nr:hypothetical protein SCHPADRAFT_952843 [Schizopora paradoxa]
MSNATALPPVPPDISFITGPFLFGYLFNWTLFGVLSVQVYIYYISFPKDRLFAKCLVASVYILETIQTAMLGHDAFETLAKGFGNVVLLNSLQLEWLTVPVFTGVLSCVVQLFYAYRVALLSNSKLMGLAVAVAVTQATNAIIQGIQALVINDFSKLRSEALVTEAIWLIGSAICDLMIVSFMTYALLKKRVYIKSTQTVVTRVIRIIVETGCLTATAATFMVILFFAFPDKTYYTCPGLFLAKLYSNSFLVILNTRVVILGGRNQVSRVAVGRLSSSRRLSRVDFANPGTTKQTSAGPTSHIELSTRVTSPVSNPSTSQSDTLQTLSQKGDLDSWLTAEEAGLDIRLDYQVSLKALR